MLLYILLVLLFLIMLFMMVSLGQSYYNGSLIYLISFYLHIFRPLCILLILLWGMLMSPELVGQEEPMSH
jgi:hypothetical protein